MTWVVAVVTSLLLMTTSDAASYLVRTATALLAVAVLLRTARIGRVRAALLAAAVLAGVLSGVVATVHLLITGHTSPPGAAADWIYLAYAPLAVAGLLSLPRQEVQGRRLRTLFDATVAAGSGIFVLLCLDARVVTATTGTASGNAATTLYPVSAVLVMAVVLAVLPRVREDVRAFTRCAGVGLAILTIGDVGYAFGALHHWYTPTTWPALASELGLGLLAVAPLVRRHEQGRVRDVVESTAGYLPLVPSIILAFVQFLEGRPLTVLQTGVGVIVAVGMLGRQVVSNLESENTIRSLIVQDRESRAAALSDPLTGLGNRTAVNVELERLLEQSAGPVLLALLDLDDFKDINDTHGHETGDTVLCAVARRLEDAVPAGAVIARLGGDEFAVALCSADGPAALGATLHRALEATVDVGWRAFAITASIGVVVVDAGAGTAFSHADLAMYQAKSGKQPQQSAVTVLTGAARDRAEARVQLRDQVSHPDLTEFRVVFEPLVELSTGAVVGAEALLRWEHPTLGTVSPTEFIPLAEQVGAIAELGLFALEEAVAALAEWTKSRSLRIGVNLSPRQLGQPDLVPTVAGLLSTYRVAPSALLLEITEQALLDDWTTAVEVVGRLRALGVGVAVDDFGTGYSSLRYLRRFDTTVIKVDREFVQAQVDEPRTRALVASVVEMARLLGQDVVAEGIETLDQLAVVRSQGCAYAQGYLFDQPMPRAAFGELLRDGHRYPLGQMPTPVIPRARPAISIVSPRQLG
jgi:diguanylate cyclase (GGDEF)-like protein